MNSADIYVTLGETIAKVDKNKLNAYGDDMKTEWISKVEGRIQTEVMELPPERAVRYDWKRDKGRNLLVPHPYTDVYRYYLYAMVDFENREIASYNNNMVMFNSEFEAYQAYYRRSQPQAAQIKNIW